MLKNSDMGYMVLQSIISASGSASGMVNSSWDIFCQIIEILIATSVFNNECHTVFLK